VARWQLWQSEDRTELSFFPASNTQARQIAEADGDHLVWEVDAIGWNAAMAARNEHLGWEPYRPMLRPDGTCYPEDESDPERGEDP
jgi:hypothetical protein